MAFSDPAQNIAQLDLEIGQHVADLGVGSGFYAIEAAKAVGGEGRVYAVDVQKDLLDKLKNGSKRENVNNIEVVWGDLDRLGGSKLRDASIDVVLATNILFMLEDPQTFATEVYRILKPNGRVLVVDWMESFGNMGPPQNQIFDQKRAEELFVRHGFVKEKEISAGAHHYGFILKHE